MPERAAPIFTRSPRAQVDAAERLGGRAVHRQREIASGDGDPARFRLHREGRRRAS